jgi:Holliday junction resolvase RusA-like endonuclease
MISLKGLPLPVPVNRQWRSSKGGVYLSAEARKKRAAIAAAIHAQIGGQPKEPITGPCTISITWTPRDNRLADVDAYIKGCLDAITQAGCWLDDKQVDLVSCERLPTPKHPGSWSCEIWAIEEGRK